MHAAHGRRTMTMLLALGTVLVLAATIPWTTAAESDREMTWQFSIPISFTGGASFGADGTTVDVNDDVGWGFSFGYNLNPKLLLGGDITWLSANYNASVATDLDGDQILDDSIDLAGTLDASNLQFFGQYHFLTGRVTPFVRASFGWTWVDSNIPSGPTEGVCWWDPWWGYVCDTWQPTYEDTSFAYGVAAGVRAELTEKVYLEGSYNVLWVDFNRAGSQDLDGVRFSVGWMF